MGAGLHGWPVYYYQGCIDLPHKLGSNWWWPSRTPAHMLCAGLCLCLCQFPGGLCATIAGRQAPQQQQQRTHEQEMRREWWWHALVLRLVLTGSVPCTPLFVDWHCHFGCVYVCLRLHHVCRVALSPLSCCNKRVTHLAQEAACRRCMWGDCL